MPLRATITIATTAKTPAHQRQRCHHDMGNDASFTASDESSDETQQRRRRLRINDGNDAITTMPKTPASINMLTMAPIAQPYS
jgi:hypothetical protein